MYSEDLSRIEEVVRVKYSTTDIVDTLKNKRQRALENQLYERGREDAFNEAITLLTEYLTDWSEDND